MRLDCKAPLLLCLVLDLAENGATAFTSRSGHRHHWRPREFVRSEEEASNTAAGRPATVSLHLRRERHQGRGDFAAPLSALDENEDEIIDAIIVEEIAQAKSSVSGLAEISASGEERVRKRDVLRKVLRRLASLSLEDYKWRSSVFKSNEADRQVEESVARMMGEDAAYVRPMDASEEKRGPLGRAEKKLVTWLSSVIEEEGERAKRIANSDGDLVRPIDLDSEVGGPLANLERGAIDFVDSIRSSEKERCNTRTLRPKDLDESKRGPLGKAEAKAVSTLKDIASAEKIRAEQSKIRGGEVVRPIDVPGPLGEVERKVMEVISAEKQRAKERESNDGRVVRPKDSTMPGPLGEAERQAMDAVNRLKEEEKERLKNIKRVLEEKRPMEADRESPLGLTEAFTIGLLRGPRLLFQVVNRVGELMQSENLDDKDTEVLRLSPPSSAPDGKDSEEGGEASDKKNADGMNNT